MTAAIFATIFFWPLGIPAIVNASHANAEARAGHHAEAQRAVKRAKRWIVASFLAFGLFFVLVVGTGISVPIYVEYVKTARASDAKTTIIGVWQAAQVFYQDKGEWPATVEELEQESYLQMAQSTRLQWTFSIVGVPPMTITAVSTEQMKGGAGKTVTYNIEDGCWSGYGMPNE
ncbi:MAG: CD225/dispanin family protein [bacterium]|nr:CD225/dispanin family protein [bacterium]